MVVGESCCDPGNSRWTKEEGRPLNISNDLKSTARHLPQIHNVAFQKDNDRNNTSKPLSEQIKQADIKLLAF